MQVIDSSGRVNTSNNVLCCFQDDKLNASAALVEKFKDKQEFNWSMVRNRIGSGVI